MPPKYRTANLFLMTPSLEIPKCVQSSLTFLTQTITDKNCPIPEEQTTLNENISFVATPILRYIQNVLSHSPSILYLIQKNAEFSYPFPVYLR